MKMGVGEGRVDEMCVRMGKSIGQWVISARSRISKARGGQPSRAPCLPHDVEGGAAGPTFN